MLSVNIYLIYFLFLCEFNGTKVETVDITTYLRLYLQTYFETKRDEKRVLRKNKMVKKVISTDIFT